MNRTAVLRSYQGRVTAWCGRASVDNACANQPVHLQLVHPVRRQTELNRISPQCIVIQSNYIQNKVSSSERVGNTFLHSFKSLQQVFIKFYLFRVRFCRSQAVLTKSTPSAVQLFKLWYKYGLFPRWFIILSGDFWLCTYGPEHNFAALNMLNVGFMQFVFDLTEAALVRPIFLAPLFFGGMMLTRMQWSAQLEVANANEDWQECAELLQPLGQDTIAITFCTHQGRDEDIVRRR